MADRPGAALCLHAQPEPERGRGQRVRPLPDALGHDGRGALPAAGLYALLGDVSVRGEWADDVCAGGVCVLGGDRRRVGADPAELRPWARQRTCRSARYRPKVAVDTAGRGD